MKRVDPQSVKDIIDRVLAADNIRQSVREHRVCYLWPEIVGPGINRYTTRRYVAGGVLHVYLTSAALKNELLFHRERLVELLNKAAGEDVITEISIH